MGVNIAGINIFAGIPPLIHPVFDTTGRVFFVGTTAVPGGVVGVDAAGAYGDSPQRPFATIDYAHNQCTASRGDLIIVLPGHAETVTAAITSDLIGVRIAGIGSGRNRPAITPSGAIDTSTVTAASVWYHNLRFVAPAADCTAQINIAAADFKGTDIVIEHGAAPLVAVTVASGGDRLTFDGCLWRGTAAGPDVAIDFESSASDEPTVKNCTFNYRASSGCDLGVIRANADQVLGGVFENLVMLKVDTVAIDFNSSASVSDGIVSNCRFHATAALTSIEDIVDPGGYHFFECYAHDGTSATTHAAHVPVTSVA